jgi:hypothetical protein
MISMVVLCDDAFAAAGLFLGLRFGEELSIKVGRCHE